VATQTNVPLLTVDDVADRREDFADFFHMTDRGAGTFTRAIGDWLAAQVPREALTTCT
jgi:hypothetical protein